MRAFIEVDYAFTICRVMRPIMGTSREYPHSDAADPNGQLKARFFALLERLEIGGEVPRTDAIDRFARDETLDELVASIERDIGANRPAAALDLLHTYCMKKFGHLLDVRNVSWERAEPLHSRVGKIRECVGQDRNFAR